MTSHLIPSLQGDHPLRWALEDASSDPLETMVQCSLCPHTHRAQAGRSPSRGHSSPCHPGIPRGTQPAIPSPLQSMEFPTVLSSPSVIIIRKNMMAKKVDPTMLAIASG